jgi:CMP-N-acetylneuraminic acid synthetase
MKILALITARGGSKRLPGKNIRMLGERPLILWTIEAAKNISDVCEILVSTDNEEIGSICRDAGALVPWLRPDELSSDEASSVDVALHALDWYETEKGIIDGVLLLQPTSPFRTKLTIQKGITFFKENKQKPVLGVSLTNSHPMLSLKIEGHYLKPFMENHGLGNKSQKRMRSQDLPPVYIDNGSFYLINPNDLRKNYSFVTSETIPLVIESPQEALDIDTEWDFRLAEFFAGTVHES